MTTTFFGELGDDMSLDSGVFLGWCVGGSVLASGRANIYGGDSFGI